MTSTAPSTLRSISKSLRTIEATASVFFAFVVGLVTAIAGGVVVFGTIHDRAQMWLIAFVVPAVVCEFWFLAWLKTGLERYSAGGFAIVEIVRRQPRWPLMLRPLVSTWYLAHAAAAFSAAVVLERVLHWHDLTAGRFAVQAMTVVLALFTISHTSHLYLLLGTHVLLRSESTNLTLWRWRFVIDLIVLSAVTSLFSLKAAR